jgi:hypothetical protein
MEKSTKSPRYKYVSRFAVQVGSLFLNPDLKLRKSRYYFLTKEAAKNALNQWYDKQESLKRVIEDNFDSIMNYGDTEGYADEEIYGAIAEVFRRHTQWKG